ncbi:MAG: TetR family transcriptional regulator [Rhizomicrobium sp.]
MPGIFAAVAEAAGLAKSLVSHHFSTREQLVRDAARLLVAGVQDDLASLSARLDGLAAELRAPVEISAYIVEHLVTGPAQSGTALLEFASLALTEAHYREIFLQLIAQIGTVFPNGSRPEREKHLMAFVVGELLAHCPQRCGPIALAGLRKRLGWFMTAEDTDQARWLSRLLVVLESGGAVDGGQVPPGVPAGLVWDRSHGPSEPTERRAAIVSAALEVLAESDAASVTHRKIAERAEVPLAATTYHFASKMAILEAAYQRIIEVAMAESRRLSDIAMGGGERSFQHHIAMMLDFYASDGLRSTLAHFHLALSACRNDGLAAFAVRAHDTEVELLRASARQLGITLDRNLAQAVTSLVGGTLLFRMLGYR